MFPRRTARRVLATTLAAAALTLSPAIWGDEGQWMPEQIAELDPARLAAMGLALPPSAIHAEHAPDLLDAVVYYAGCSASFISAEGLIATNHHCAYADLQSQSTPEHDYLTDGFLAPSRDQELQTKSRGTVEILEQVTDVTDVLGQAIAGIDDDGARHRAIDKAEKKLVADCETARHVRCRVASFYEGSLYRLYRFLELRDLRIAYAPPASIGEYGGDIDNWMWPRHTGDFAILRAYVGPDGVPAGYAPDNVPYRPVRHLKVSPHGVERGDFVMIMGYPGSTNRHLPAVEVARHVDQVLPSRADLYGEWVRLLDAESARGKDVAIKVAATKKSLANREKNARGMLAGIARMSLLGRRLERDRQLEAYASQTEEHRDTLKKVAALSQRRAAAYPRAFLLDALRRGPNLLPLATDLARRAVERDKPDLERASRFMDRGVAKLKKNLERRLRDYDRDVEAKLLASLVAHADGVDIPAFTALRARAGDDVAAYLRGLLDATRLTDRQEVMRLFEAADAEAMKASDDPLLKLAMSLLPSIEAEEAEAEAIEGAEVLVGPKWFALLKAQHTGPLYPDANRTLRFSIATVQGYAPRDGLFAVPHTTLSGAIAKHTGEEPFDLPERVRAAAAEGAQSVWAPPELGDVPICFLANGDTTGGNSGSAVVNGKGELVGLNFDRVWENIAGDFGYNPPLSRNIVVDARYLLFLMDRVDDAGHLLRELGL
ncbi:MAG TPA: S46 family peptidase, partial [Polyangiaceae bacterium]|nr:S46 family peptidase [Polyangiaceae bacterium]